MTGSVMDASLGRLRANADESSPVVATATWGYVRLRRFDYDVATLAVRAQRLAAQPWSEVFVYFKHDEGEGFVHRR